MTGGDEPRPAHPGAAPSVKARGPAASVKAKGLGPGEADGSRLGPSNAPLAMDRVSADSATAREG